MALRRAALLAAPLAAALILAGAGTAPAQSARLKPVKAQPPALELRDASGRLHRLADYRGRVVLVNFWASWCEPCLAEMPALERLRAKLADERFTLLAVNVGEGEAAIERFLAKLPAGFTILLDRDQSVSRAWKAGVLPATAILDPGSTLRYAVTGAIDWDDPAIESQLRKLLRPTKPSIQGQETSR